MHKQTKIAATVESAFGAKISDAASSEVKVRDKWLALGHGLFNDAGVTVAMLTASTDKHPNDAADASLIETVERFILAGVSASKKPMKFDTINPRVAGKVSYMWTVADLDALDRDTLRTINDETLKAQRRYWKQQVGSLFNKVKQYVDRFENPDKHRAEKKEKKDAGAAKATEAVYNSMGAHLAHLTAMMAQRNTIGLTAAESDTYGNALEECIVLMRAAKAKADKLAK